MVAQKRGVSLSTYQKLVGGWVPDSRSPDHMLPMPCHVARVAAVSCVMHPTLWCFVGTCGWCLPRQGCLYAHLVSEQVPHCVHMACR